VQEQVQEQKQVQVQVQEQEQVLEWTEELDWEDRFGDPLGGQEHWIEDREEAGPDLEQEPPFVVYPEEPQTLSSLEPAAPTLWLVEELSPPRKKLRAETETASLPAQRHPVSSWGRRRPTNFPYSPSQTQ